MNKSTSANTKENVDEELLLPLSKENLQDSESDELGYDTQSTDDTIKVDSDQEVSAGTEEKRKRKKKKSKTKVTSNAKKQDRVAYRCNKCQQIKKGHVCPITEKNPFYSDDNINPMDPQNSQLPSNQPIEHRQHSVVPDALPTVIPTSNTLVGTSSFPTGVSLGWFDLAINSISTLHKNLSYLPRDEWEPLGLLVDHLGSAKQYFAIMKEEYEIVTTVAQDPASQLLGKRSVSILRDVEQGLLQADPEDLAAEPAHKRPALEI